MYASIIIPTFNERESLPLALAALHVALREREDWEVVIVDDDSPDRTWELAQELAADNPRIRVYRRINRRGLSSAIVDGLSLGTGDRLLVMDADLQHDTTRVPALLAALDDTPVAIGTRYARHGGTGHWSLQRVALSRVATLACQLVLGVSASDPMSGFFAIRREDFLRLAPRLNPRGYKTLMEILHSMRPPLFSEVPYVFAHRRAGESKLSGHVVWDFGLSLAELWTRSTISARFLKYCLVGLSGVAVHNAAFHLAWKRIAAADTATALAIATAAASNYCLNNAWTFRDRAHRGSVERLRGGALFMAISATGALVNQGLTWYLNDRHLLALFPAMAVGLAVSTVWNYYLNFDLTWRGHAYPE